MIATITPYGREPFDLSLTGEPRFADKASGGYGDATIPCTLEPWMLDRLLDARVQLTSAHGECYAGWVWDWGSGGLECVGPASRLGLIAEDCMFIDSSLQPWREATIDARSRNISVQTDALGITLALTTGITYATGEANYAFRRMDPRDHPRVSFAYNQAGLSGTRLELWAGIAGTGNEGINWGATYEWSYSGGSSGTATVDVSIHNVIALAFRLYVNTGGTVGTNTGVTVTNLRVYGEGVTDPTPYNVLANVIGRLPSGDYPTGGLGRITTGESALAHLVTTGTLADVVTGVCAQTGGVAAFRSRDIAGLPSPVLLYGPRPTTPAYYTTHDGQNVKAALKGASMSDLRSGVAYQYTDIAGIVQKARLADTDTSHYLVKTGRRFDERRTMATTDATQAAAGAAAVLAAKGAVQHGGTVSVTGPHITDANGIPVPPERVEAGQLIVVGGTVLGDVTAYIEQADHDGERAVTLRLDDSMLLPVSVQKLVGR